MDEVVDAFMNMHQWRNIHRNRRIVSMSNIPKKKQKHYDTQTTDAYVKFFNANQKFMALLKPLTDDERNELSTLIVERRGF